MFKIIRASLLLMWVGCTCFAKVPEGPVVQFDIEVSDQQGQVVDHGRVLVALASKEAPKTTRNFLNYVQAKFYDDTIFHRMIPQFMIQGGGFNGAMSEKKANAPIENEANAKLENRKGTIAMARTMDVNSATSQFFINFTDNAFLNHRDDSAEGFGYAVFGQVIDGMPWLEKLQSIATTTIKGYSDVPVNQVKIKRAFVLSSEEKSASASKSHLP